MCSSDLAAALYRPGDPVSFADPVERRSMGQHLDRLLLAGQVEETAPGRYRTRAV